MELIMLNRVDAHKYPRSRRHKFIIQDKNGKEIHRSVMLAAMLPITDD